MYVGIINEDQKELMSLQRNNDDISPRKLCAIMVTSVQKGWLKLE